MAEVDGGGDNEGQTKNSKEGGTFRWRDEQVVESKRS